MWTVNEDQIKILQLLKLFYAAIEVGWILSKFVFIAHIFHLISGVKALQTNWATMFQCSGVLLHLAGLLQLVLGIRLEFLA